MVESVSTSYDLFHFNNKFAGPVSIGKSVNGYLKNNESLLLKNDDVSILKLSISFYILKS